MTTGTSSTLVPLQEVPLAAERRAAGPTREYLIQPVTAWSGLKFSELWEYRELLFYLMWRDTVVRYKQTVLGVGWAVLQPLLTMAVFSIFFGKLGRMNEQVSAPYPVFAYAALLPWMLFVTNVNQAAIALVNNVPLVRKVYFPRLILPVAAAGRGVLDFLFAYAVLFGLMLLHGIEPTWAHLLVPCFVAGTLVASLGVGIWLSALTVAYRDFRHLVTFLLQLWMFASPVVYPVTAIPSQWQMVYALNPMVGIISGFRSIILGDPFDATCIGMSTLSTLVIFVVSVYYFHRVEHKFADVI